MRRSVRTIVIAGIWLFLWQLAAWQLDRELLFVGPVDVCRALMQQAREPEFWLTIAYSSSKICAGFLAAFACGVFVAAAAGKYRMLGEFLEPAIGFLQSVPVASFIILALIWIGSENLSVLVSFLVVFPVIYRNTVQGMISADRALLEMAQIYTMGVGKRFFYIYWPSIFPYLLAGSKTAFALAWKSGVAAEVIGVPQMSIGEKLYLAKIYLSTAELFAWTLVVILASRLFEVLFLRLFSLLDIRRKGGASHGDLS